jgi:hypothetical protein
MSVGPRENAGPLQSMRGTLNVALFVVRSWATSLEVFLHRDIGERYLGWNAAAVLVLVPLYMLGWEGYDARPMEGFLLAFLGMCAVSRMAIFRRRLQGGSCHSLYTGWPRFLGAKAKITELRMKQVYEPIGVFVLGLTFRDYEGPLATYLMIGAVCLFISVSASGTLERIRSLDLNDAVIEQELAAERFRGMRGDS